MKMGSDAPTDPGDDSGILHGIMRWRERPMEEQGLAEPHLGFVQRADDGSWVLLVNLNRVKKRQHHFFQVDPRPLSRPRDRWQLLRLGPGVWTVLPSVHVPGQLHAFLTIINVPEPPPW